jgi:hypothetical protein
MEWPLVADIVDLVAALHSSRSFAVPRLFIEAMFLIRAFHGGLSSLIVRIVMSSAKRHKDGIMPANADQPQTESTQSAKAHTLRCVIAYGMKRPRQSEQSACTGFRSTSPLMPIARGSKSPEGWPPPEYRTLRFPAVRGYRLTIEYPAIHVECLASYKCRVVRSKECDGTNNVFRFAEPMQVGDLFEIRYPFRIA